MLNSSYAEYLWLDGANPTQEIRSKTRILSETSAPNLEFFPEWSFDGSSTNQATGDNSDCLLKPVFFTKDPLREGQHYVVLCEVLNPDGTPHPTNQRARLKELMDKGGAQHDPLIGFEQEYTFFNEQTPLGWPKGGYPAPQGPFYCGVGSSKAFGREIVEDHMNVCSAAGLALYGINAEVMPGQWEFQVGYRGREEAADPLTISDHLWVARYFLHRIAEGYGVTVSLSNKPIHGDWNGAGMHTNFSTALMRDKGTGMSTIEKAIQHLGENHASHVQEYGFGLADRLTGLHETCDINQFRSGVSDRGASIRIPVATSQKGYGYIEDRRPGANSDPYRVSAKLVETICQI